MKKSIYRLFHLPIIIGLIIWLLPLIVSAEDQAIKIGWATVNITPTKPVQLFGQYNERISQGVHDSLYATAMAIESESGDMQAIMVSMEILEGTYNLQKDLRNLLSGKLRGFNLKNLIINATHTHTAPYPFTPPDRSKPAGLMTGEEYRNRILLPKLADIVAVAWNSRAAAAVGFAKSTADVGYSRICTYLDGHEVMLGSTANDKGSPFSSFNGGNDQALNLMYCFDTAGNIKGIVINIACPAQDVAGLSVISADFWGEVRTRLQVRYPGIFILEQCSAAGDQGPWNLAAGERGDTSWSRRTTHATRIVNEVNRYFNIAQSCRQSSVELNNQVRDYTLTQKACYGTGPFTWELHTIRIGNAVFANNPFELYIDYGYSIKAQSRADQTFLVQLSGTASDDFLINYTLDGNLYGGYMAGYIPTAKAVSGKAYGSLDENGRVGPEGGAQLVSQTVSLINGMFRKDNATSKCIVEVSKPGSQVAPICRGQELEEFNHGIEGGLYAQMINNPSFEEVVDEWGAPYPDKYWSIVVPGNSAGTISGQTSANTDMLNSHQVHCLKLSVTSVASGSVGLKNDGFWGMKLENNTTYKVSFWAKKGPDFSGTLKASLESSDGTSYASHTFSPTAKWAQYTCDLVPTGIPSVSGNNRFVIYASTTGDVYFDVVTIMPPTWKNHGCRIDIAKYLDDMHLKFLAYPGGLDAHWANYNYCRRWKESIGPLEERGGSTQYVWGYKNDLYFGTDEFFQLAEDLGAEPMYVFTAGIISFMRPDMPDRFTPIDSLHFVITDILDFLEYCNGSVTSKWGALRAKNGHPSPYNLKYVQIGAENDNQLKEYLKRYPIIHDSIKAHYPEMRIAMCGNFNEDQGIAHPYGQSFWVVDCHGLDADNSHRYFYFDSVNCDAGINRFMVQEYCSSHKGMAANVVSDFQDAIADAIYMLGCEKNSARMFWTGFGNFGSLAGHGQFGCNLLNFDAVSSFACPGYYMQKMLFSDNPGTRILPFTQNTANCYWSASIDTEQGKNDVLIKVANKSAVSESVDITLKGVEKVDAKGISTTITGKPDDENSLANPTKIIPKAGTFVAGINFKYNVPAYSINVLRIKVLK